MCFYLNNNGTNSLLGFIKRNNTDHKSANSFRTFSQSTLHSSGLSLNMAQQFGTLTLRKTNSALNVCKNSFYSAPLIFSISYLSTMTAHLSAKLLHVQTFSSRRLEADQRIVGSLLNGSLDATSHFLEKVSFRIPSYSTRNQIPFLITSSETIFLKPCVQFT